MERGRPGRERPDRGGGGQPVLPAASVRVEYFEDSTTHTTCPWKGEASYRTVVVDGKRNDDAAWYYPDPKEAAREITDHVAFWRGVEVTELP